MNIRGLERLSDAVEWLRGHCGADDQCVKSKPPALGQTVEAIVSVRYALLLGLLTTLGRLYLRFFALWGTMGRCPKPRQRNFIPLESQLWFICLSIST